MNFLLPILCYDFTHTETEDKDTLSVQVQSMKIVNRRKEIEANIVMVNDMVVNIVQTAVQVAIDNEILKLQMLRIRKL